MTSRYPPENIIQGFNQKQKGAAGETSKESESRTPLRLHPESICNVRVLCSFYPGLRVETLTVTVSHKNHMAPNADHPTGMRKLFICRVVSILDISLPPKACNIMEICRIKRSVQLERGVKDGRHGYMATVYGEGGTSRTIFYPFSGVTEELKAFFSDISETSKEQEPRRLSCVEGTRDVAVLGAMLESGARNGAVVPVAKF
ncbi:hypothetical protein HID58_043582 [Brassica napus]|uniref:Gfo/Idh/MocA-like oxidoreductase C-terminal domain-containing protein n=1 Tax=Brassica napus TaxID=3708 RepID=A0ABQ8BGZ9_BRANA|nr:hypothetical protein HID58_043582 [Brassica napus]